MIIKSILEKQKGIDTVVCFTKYDTAPRFTCETLQKRYDENFGTCSNSLKPGEIKVDRLLVGDSVKNIVVVGFDCKKKDVFDFFKKVTYKIGLKLNQLNSKKILIDGLTDLIFIEDKNEIVRQFSIALPLTEYKFDKYITKKEHDKKEKEIYIFGDYQEAINEGINIAEGIIISRDLTNEPANVLTPEELASRVQDMGNKYGFEVEVLSKDKCEEMGMGAFIAVARASEHEPKLIIMRYKGNPDDEKTRGIIGKGLCYDSGGLYLKPGKSMETMSGDMAGAGSVIGAMCSLASNRAKVNVTTVVAACENSVDGKSYRNGDILTTMSGKTVLIGSTDAEGRLTLADAITYMIRNENVCDILELSTLTGSTAMFLGGVCSGIYTTNDESYENLSKVSETSCEKYYRFPVFDEYKDYIKVDTADLYNTSKSGASGITAGVFLNEFAENMPYIHMDIAGVSRSSAKKDGLASGATGYGVRTIYEYLK